MLRHILAPANMRFLYGGAEQSSPWKNLSYTMIQGTQMTMAGQTFPSNPILIVSCQHRPQWTLARTEYDSDRTRHRVKRNAEHQCPVSSKLRPFISPQRNSELIFDWCLPRKNGGWTTRRREGWLIRQRICKSDELEEVEWWRQTSDSIWYSSSDRWPCTLIESQTEVILPSQRSGALFPGAQFISVTCPQDRPQFYLCKCLKRVIPHREMRARENPVKFSCQPEQWNAIGEFSLLILWIFPPLLPL